MKNLFEKLQLAYPDARRIEVKAINKDSKHNIEMLVYVDETGGHYVFKDNNTGEHITIESTGAALNPSNLEYVCKLHANTIIIMSKSSWMNGYADFAGFSGDRMVSSNPVELYTIGKNKAKTVLLYADEAKQILDETNEYSALDICANNYREMLGTYNLETGEFTRCS